MTTAPMRSAGSPPRSAAGSTSRRCSRTSSTIRWRSSRSSGSGSGCSIRRASSPLTLAAQRGVPDEVVEWVSTLAIDDEAVGLAAIRSRRVVAIPDALAAATMPAQREVYARHGIGSVCFVPIVFRDEPLGLLVLYHETVRDWTADETELARAFADQMAIAIGNARLDDSVQALAARLRAIPDLAGRLNRIQDLDGIAAVIVEGTERLIDHDTIRVYRVDHDTRMCEPIAFQGGFAGHATPSLRCSPGADRRGPDRLGRRAQRDRDRRRRRRRPAQSPDRPDARARIDAPRPDVFDDRVHGVIVVSAAGRDRFGPDDETTLTIFAGYAAQAIVNADHLERLHRQQRELEHQLDGQRRLLEVNERLLSTLDPAGVLDLIADSLKAIVAVRLADDLPLRPGGRRPPGGHRPRPLRRPDPRLRGPARRRDHRLGHRPRRGGPRERGPPRPALRPGPGHAVRARVDDRRPADRRRRGDRHAEHRADGRGRRRTSARTSSS